MTLLNQDHYISLVSDPDLEKKVKTAIFNREEKGKRLTLDELALPNAKMAKPATKKGFSLQ
jgi:hypothetical protein